MTAYIQWYITHTICYITPPRVQIDDEVSLYMYTFSLCICTSNAPDDTEPLSQSEHVGSSSSSSSHTQFHYHSYGQSSYSSLHPPPQNTFMDHQPHMSFQLFLNQVSSIHNVFPHQMSCFSPPPNMFGTSSFTHPSTFHLSSSYYHPTLPMQTPNIQHDNDDDDNSDDPPPPLLGKRMPKRQRRRPPYRTSSHK